MTSQRTLYSSLPRCICHHLGSQSTHFHWLDISLDTTFGELADAVLNNDDNALLPDFWSRKIDHSHNRVTTSGVMWEWQDPNEKVLAVLTREREGGKKECLRIEKVVKDGEYVVALVRKDEREGPMPVGEFFHDIVCDRDMLTSDPQMSQNHTASPPLSTSSRSSQMTQYPKCSNCKVATMLPKKCSTGGHSGL